MNKYLSLVLLFLLMVNNAFGSPLILTVSKDINAKDKYVELITFDATKFKQIRVAIVLPRTALSDKEGIAFFAVEGADEIYLTDDNGYVFDSPPSRLRVKVKGQGKFTLYI